MPQFCPENDHVVKKVINLKEKKTRKKKATVPKNDNWYSKKLLFLGHKMQKMLITENFKNIKSNIHNGCK